MFKTGLTTHRLSYYYIEDSPMIVDFCADFETRIKGSSNSGSTYDPK